ncbi:hypothetical protein OF83DRAFT_1109896 [Amylostereum chailletii]|nr:hypothetical protein OF83DRAFT_1109896 [Amylostereum chailletii]
MPGTLTPSDTTDDLPEYSHVIEHLRPPPSIDIGRSSGFITSHAFYLRDGHGRPWMTLSLQSRAQSAKYLPVYCENDAITGELTLDLSGAETLKGITLTLKGSLTATGQDEIVFISETQELWSPLSPASSERFPSGTHTFPIFFPLPSEASFTFNRGPPQSHRLPPTFSERASPVYVDYRLTVSMRRSGISPNRKLSTGLAYVPREVAQKPSLMRMLAYQEGTPLLGPDEDPPGWRVLEPFNIQGTLFDTRSINVQCKFAIATPTSYVTGSPIPLFLTLRSTDVHALDLLAPGMNVRLARLLAVGNVATDESVARRSNNTFVTPVAKAVFWPASPPSPDLDKARVENGERILHGELHIPKGVKPSFVFPKISMRYQVLFFPPMSSGFVSSTPPDTPLTAEPVTITLHKPPGVVYRSFAPPGYDVAPDPVNFNIATGFLENGNQRFIEIGHHHQY